MSVVVVVAFAGIFEIETVVEFQIVFVTVFEGQIGFHIGFGVEFVEVVVV